MTTETVTDYRVETIEEDKDITWCDKCNQKIKNDEPSTEVVARPEVERKSIEMPQKLRELKEFDETKMGRTHPGMHHDITRNEVRYIVQELETSIRRLNDNSTIKAITVHEDVCGSCFKEMAGEEIGDVPGVTVKKPSLKTITSYEKKARNRSKYPRWCGWVTLAIGLFFLLSGILSAHHSQPYVAIGFLMLFPFFEYSSYKLLGWANKIRDSYSP